MEQPAAIDRLYHARDDMNAIVSKLDDMKPDEVVRALSSFRTACLTLLQNHAAFMHKLAVQTERADSTNPRVVVAVEELRSISGEMAQCAIHAERSLNTTDELRTDELRDPR